MPTRNINLTPQMDSFVDAKIQSGQYANPSEVLRVLEQSELEDQARLHALRTALQAGEESGIAEGSVVTEVRQRIQRRGQVSGRS